MPPWSGTIVPMSDEPARFMTESSRVEAFSDGVLAIALTLLVLNLHSDAGRGDFGHQLADQWPGYVAYAAAFLNIAAIWINHHDLFTRVRGIDNRVLALNLLVLFPASLLPWPAALVGAAVRNGDHHDQIVSIAVYASVAFFVPLTLAGLYTYLARAPRLLRAPSDAEYCRRVARSGLVSAVWFPVAALVALLAPVAALAIFVAVPALFLGRTASAQVGPYARG